MGLSFAELNMMSMSDYADYAEIWLGDDDDEDTTRLATQADVKRFFG